MYRSITNGPAYARIFRTVGSNQTVTGWGDPNTMDYRNDSLFALQANNTGYVFGLFSEPILLSDIVGCSAFDFEHIPDKSFLTQKPYRDAWSRGQDWKNYGNPLGLGSYLANYPAAISEREKQVSHPAFRGDIRDIYGSFYGYTDDAFHFTYNGASIPLFDIRPTTPYGLAQAVDINSVGNLVYQLYETAVPPNPHCDYFHSLMAVATALADNDVIISPVYYWNFSYSNLVNTSFSFGDFYHVGLEYDFDRRFNSGGGDLYATFRVKLDIDFRIVPTHGVNNPYDINTIQTGCFVTENKSSYSLIDRGGVYTPNYYAGNPPFEVDTEQLPGFASPVMQRDDSVATSRFFIFRKEVKGDPDRLYRRLLDSCRILLPQLRPSSFMSASDALNKHIEVLEANHLENLTQLSGLLSILPDLPKLPRMISKLINRDPSAIVEIIDYVTDAIIKFRYAQSPTVGDTIELVTTDVLGELRSLLQSKTYTLYGDFFWNFPEVDNFMGDGRLVLGTRSKVNITVDMTTLLANYLTLNSMGILPTLSRTWATLPFSFVVDWFTNMDDRLQQIDNQLLWLCVRTNWCLHSYTVSYYPSEEMLESYQLENFNPEDPFRVTAYFRELSLIMPLLRESKYDFLAPSRGPDPITVGALTWQKLRS